MTHQMDDDDASLWIDPLSPANSSGGHETARAGKTSAHDTGGSARGDGSHSADGNYGGVMNDYEAILNDDPDDHAPGERKPSVGSHSNDGGDDDPEGLIRALEHEHDVDIDIPDSDDVTIDDADAAEVRVEDALRDEHADPDGDIVLVSETIRRDEDYTRGGSSSMKAGGGDLGVGEDVDDASDDMEDGAVWDQSQVDDDSENADAEPVAGGGSGGEDHAVVDRVESVEGGDAPNALLNASEGLKSDDSSDSIVDGHEDSAVADGDARDSAGGGHTRPPAEVDEDHDGVDDREELQSVDAMAMMAGRDGHDGDSDVASAVSSNGAVSREELRKIVHSIEERAAKLNGNGSDDQSESGLPLPFSASPEASEDDHDSRDRVRPTADKMNRLIGPDDVGREAFDVDAILNDAIDHRASDVHIMAGRMIKLRIDGIMYRFTKYEPMDSYDMNAFVTDPGNGLVNADNMNEFRRTKSVDKAYVVKTGKHVGERFRVHMAEEFHGYGFVFRHVRPEIFTPEEIGVPDDVMEWTRLGQGLILVTGPTGSGKSATLATLIRSIQLNRAVKIITLEEPIETLYPLDGIADIWQKEIPDNEDEFEQGVRDAMREDPDVMLIGEIRDIGTLRATMQACNTGHLVFATIHASSAPDVITRVMEFAGDGSDRDQLRSDLARNLRGILSQRLLLRKMGAGRIAVREIMHVDQKTRRLIIGNDVSSMTRSLKMRGEDLDSQALLLALEGKTSVRSALSVSADPVGFIDMTSLLSDRAKKAIGAVGDWAGARHGEDD